MSFVHLPTPPIQPPTPPIQLLTPPIQPPPPTTQPAQAAPQADNSSKEFDFSGVPSTSTDDELGQTGGLSRAWARPRTSGSTFAGSSTLATHPASPAAATTVTSDTRAPSVSSSHSRNVALDIAYYFVKAAKASIPDFREKSASNPKLKFEFSTNTSNTTLRNHLENVHKEEYLHLCAKKGWNNLLPKSRVQAVEEVIKAWEVYFRVLKQDLAIALRKVSFTADIWSNQSCYPHLAMTTHWISRTPTGGLQFNCMLVAFHRIRGSHHAEWLVRIILHLLDRAGVTVKVGHWTLDNASVNAKFLEELQVLLEARDIPFNAKDRHIIDEAKFAAALPPVDPCQQTFDKACAQDPIALCRGAVCAIHASGKQRKMFQDIICDSNEKEWFKAANAPTKIIKLENLELLCDV
ncbi:unnamed protein product [Cyclocybe aegerita]|uniref:Uncharacterized protein n=1 Tax=Cyclocybe aegerita TaxID=1973307 RepID=A0A8S0WXZ1_CYCAE|nr:unnamed protein product [Cyclocybe aegerita]